jgi:hypothetical protein
MKPKQSDLDEGLRRLRGTPEFELFVAYLKHERDKLRTLIEQPVVPAREFLAGQMAQLSELLQMIDKQQHGL